MKTQQKKRNMWIVEFFVIPQISPEFACLKDHIWSSHFLSRFYEFSLFPSIFLCFCVFECWNSTKDRLVFIPANHHFLCFRKTHINNHTFLYNFPNFNLFFFDFLKTICFENILWGIPLNDSYWTLADFPVSHSKCSDLFFFFHFSSVSLFNIWKNLE